MTTKPDPPQIAIAIETIPAETLFFVYPYQPLYIPYVLYYIYVYVSGVMSTTHLLYEQNRSEPCGTSSHDRVPNDKETTSGRTG